MGFFEKLKEFQNQITQVENNICTNKQDFLEIYERNLQLEQEISERTKELDLTNQRMLTLQHIWDMMNSSQPLSSVFNAIVKTLQGELGYLHSAILKIENDEKKCKFLKIIAQSNDEIAQKAQDVFKVPFDELKLAFNDKNILNRAIYEKNIQQTVDLRAALKSVLPNVSEDSISSLLSNAQSHSVIVIPLKTFNEDFGCLIVFSSRDSALEEELQFLKMFSQQIELAITIADLFQAVKNQALTDPLTSLYNRRYFEENLKKEVIRSKRMGQPFTIISLDLDYLKRINDQYGHSFGDLAIKTIADVMKKNARSIDIAARIGGEEFDILLPGVDSKGGLIAAERIRAAIAEQEVKLIGHITASIGVATFPEHSNNVDELMELVDQAMYYAKMNGRNRVELAKTLSETSWQEVALNAFEKIIAKQKIPISENISRDLHKRLSQSDSSPKEALFSIADLLSNTYNPSHGQGITKSKVQFATKLAKAFELEADEIDKLRIAILMYDIGNLMIPSELLQKKEPLTKAELIQIKKHPIIAAREILKPITEIKDIIPIIEHHHENWDGSGYPSKVSGEKIPLASQIILILDAYFALIEPRTYRKAITPTQAIEVIKKDSNKKWNPKLVDEFVNLIENSIR